MAPRQAGMTWSCSQQLRLQLQLQPAPAPAPAGLIGATISPGLIRAAVGGAAAFTIGRVRTLRGLCRLGALNEGCSWAKLAGFTELAQLLRPA